MAQDGAMPEIQNKVLTVLKHKTKKWDDVNHSWQVRSLDTLQMLAGTILLNPEYPNLAIISADCAVEDFQLEDWFSLASAELDNVTVHVFPNVEPGIPEEKIFYKVTKVIEETEAKKQNN